MNIARAVANARRLIKKHHGDVPPRPDASRCQYILHVLDAMEKTQDVNERIHLLGFVHGYLWDEGFATLQEPRDVLLPE